MLVQLTSLDPSWTLIDVIGIRTLFGKKKKGKKKNEQTAEASTSSSASSPNPPMASIPLQAPPVPASAPAPPNPAPVYTATSYQPPRNWQGPPQGDEDSALTRLLHSLLRHLPSDGDSMGVDQPEPSSVQSTPE